ncbi:MAG TPA: GMC family oxidoreductase N-terminal domain-containing protein [Steroidobacteraceae bacterium]|jgi:choline dehydrogenase|nr:GMC family oxidoreductase N-terminal domain-containing protein [Steroidobacteraceae bacterium]
MDTFDYIIVGAGTAGCVLAHRLSARSRNRVLVLEAGGSDRRFWIRVPIGYGRTYNDPRVNWMYETEPDPGLNGARSFWPRGKVLGGSGSINAMVYVRGQPADFDDWAASTDPGWSWAGVRPVFEALENRADGGAGQLRVTDMNPMAHPLCRAYLRACEVLGYRYTPDFNGADSEGVGIYPATTRGGWRESTASAYLRPALARPNLVLKLRALARQIDFEGQRACGVSYLWHGSLRRAQAARAVILSAGSINSPQLLQLSGIADPGLLARFGIALRHAAPAVGQNLQDHLGINYVYRSRVPTLNDELHPLRGKILAGIEFLRRRRGPLSMSVNQGGGFIRSSADKPVPDLQLYFNPASYTSTRSRNRRLMNPDAFPGFLLSFNSCRPTSRGHLAIRSADPDVAPAIFPNYLSTERDLADVRIGVRLLRTIAATPPLAALIEHEVQPGMQLQSDQELLADFRQRAGSVFHPVGTCAMGNDPMRAVVDARLRVHGVAGLRVVDASVFPSITSGNTNAPAVMVAERGAAMILADEAGV